MKNYQKGFVIPLVIAIIVLLVIGGSAYIYSKNKEVVLENNLNATPILPPEGFESYSNKVFSAFYPKGWKVTEGTFSSHGCNATVNFVQIPLLKKNIYNSPADDFLDILKNPGSDIYISGGFGDFQPSFKDLKNVLDFTYKSEDDNILDLYNKIKKLKIDEKIDLNGKIPQLTNYFSFPEYHKKRINKSMVFNGKFPHTIQVIYTAPEKDFSEELFNIVVNSLKNELTEARCIDAISIKAKEPVTYTRELVSK